MKRASVALLLVVVTGCGLPSPSVPAPQPMPTGAVSLVVEPDDGAQAVLAVIDGARSSVWMEMYLLTDDRPISALVGRAAAGCDVRVILEQAPYDDEQANQDAYARLAAGGVDVRWASARFTYTHAKVMVVDHARLAILTLNLSAAGLGGNREYAVIDEDPVDVAAAETIFTADELGAPTGPPGGRVVSSPETTRAELMDLLQGARRSLAIETEELTDAPTTDALLAALARGVAVTLAWPGPSGGPGTPFAALAAAGAVVRVVTAPSIHAKATVADAERVYLGSANFTPTSLDDNRELGLRIDDPGVAARIGGTVAADAAIGVPP